MRMDGRFTVRAQACLQDEKGYGAPTLPCVRKTMPFSSARLDLIAA